MDTNLHDPRGKIRCIQQEENEKLQKAEDIITKFSKYMKYNGLKPIDDHKKLLKELEIRSSRLWTKKTKKH